MRHIEKNNGVSNLLFKKGKTLLATTAMTAVSLLPLSSVSYAADDWGDHTQFGGSAGSSIDVNVDAPNSLTTIDQMGSVVKVRGDADLKSGWTVNINQESRTSKYVLFDVEDGHSQINGNINANGEIYVFDRDGVIFGADSVVDVGSIVASSGNLVSSDAQLNAGTLLIDSSATDGDVINRGTITVAEAGVAGFVAPTILNSGVINARLSNVVMAAGEVVTLDMYGDGLVELAVNGELSDGLITNTGAINAHGGNVQISAKVAKDAVDNVINMGGVTTVSSAVVKGGKIILSGGSSGRVNVKGNLQAGGEAQDAGSIEVTGENVRVTSTGLVRANASDGAEAGKIDLIAANELRINGRVRAIGAIENEGSGEIETSAPITSFGAGASILASREWLLDPTNITIDTPLAALLSAQLNVGDMTVMTPLAGSDEGDIGVTAVVDWATDKTFKLVAADDVFLSAIGGGINATGAGNFVVEAGDDFRMNVGNNSINTAGGNVKITAGDEVTIDDGVINAGGGDILIDNAEQFQAVADSLQTSGTGTITLNQNKDANGNTSTTDATLQNAINAINNTGTGTNTVNVGAGTYTEAVVVDRAVSLIGAGRDQVFVTSGSAAQNAFTVDGDFTIGAGGKGRVGIFRMDISDSKDGIAVADSATNLSHLIVGGAKISNNANVGLRVTGTGTENTFVQNTNFVDNGTSTTAGNGDGDLSFYKHNGNVTLKNVNITNDSGLATDGEYAADYGIQFRGADALAKSGNIDFDNVNISGRYRAALLGIQEFSELGDITLNDVTLGGLVNGTPSANSGGFAALYMGGVNNAGDLDFGNLTFAELDSNWNYITNYTGYDIDATDMTFEGIKAADATVEESFAIEDRINHKLDFAPLGLVTWQEDNVFVTQASNDFLFSGGNGGIQRGVDASNVGGTVWVDDGTYAESVNVNKTVNLFGNNAGINGSDGARGPESLVTPNSPGFLITADDVVLDGFAIDGADDGVSVSNADNVSVKNNVITNSDDNGIKFVSSNNGFAQGNAISNAGHNGIAAIDSDNVTINMENTIDGTSSAGVALNRTTNSLVDGNDISNTGGSGVWINQADGSTVSNNDIDTTWLNGSRSTGAGVHVVDTADSTVSANTIENVTRNGSGVEVINSADAEVDGNDIDVATNGVRATDSNDVVISNNEIDDVSDAAIKVTNSNDAQIISNEINDNGASTFTDYGILVEGGNSVDVDDNKIEETSIAGIAANNTTYIDIDDNLVKDVTDGIRVSGGHHADIRRNETRDMSDDGIQVISHNDVDVEGNKVLRSDDSGITVSNSQRAKIDDNNVDVAKNGIRVSGGSNATVSNNEIDDASDAGIRVTNNNDAQIISNEVNDNGASTYTDYGILVEGGNSVDVDDNKIEETSIAGIAANNTTYVDIDDNLVKDGAKGIAVDGGYNADIRRNTVQDMGDDGISVEDHNNVDVEDNTVRRVDGNGIFVEDSDEANISGNTVDDSGENGIYLSNSDDSEIIDNDITDSAQHGIKVNPSNFVDIADNIIDGSGWDGINVDRGFAADIWNNTITDSGFDAIDVNRNNYVDIWDNDIDGAGDNGIEVSSSSNTEIYDNDITGAGNDGINVDRSDATEIYGNLIYGQATASSRSRRDQSIQGAGRDGIHVVSSTNVIIDDNTIQGDSANRRKDGLGAGRHGIFVSGGNTRYFGNGVKVTNNNILGDGGFFHSSDSVGEDGIHIEDNGAGFFGSAPVISGNEIEKTGQDGIDVESTNFVNIIDNEIHDAGDDGIKVDGGVYAYIFDNHVGRTGDDGIDVDENFGVRIHDNYIHNTGRTRRNDDGNGIEVSRSYDADIRDNYVEYAGDDGIDLERSSYADVRGNEIRFSGDDGIDVENAYKVDINDNHVHVALGDGITVQDSYDADVIANRIHYVGNDGIYARNNTYSDIRENNIHHTFRDGIDVEDSDWVDVNDNIIDRVGGNGIEVQGSDNADIMGNEITNTNENGIYVNPSDFVQIDNNTISFSGEDGIHVEGGYDVEITNNIIDQSGNNGIDVEGNRLVLIDTNQVDNSGNDGINVLLDNGYSPDRVQSFSISVYDPSPSRVTIRDNIVTNSGTPFPEEKSLRKIRRKPGGDGIQVGGFDEILVEGNNVSGSVENGLFVSGAYNGEVEVSGNTFTDNDIGAHFQSGEIDLTGDRNFFNDGRVGMRFAPVETYENYYNTFSIQALPIEPSFASLSLVGNTIGAQTFDGQEESYVELDNEAFFAPGSPTLLNALDSTYLDTPFGAVTPSVDFAAGFTPEQLAHFESKFVHFNDNGNTGLFFFPLLPGIDQEDVLRYFGPNANALSGLNVTILGLPGIPGGAPIALNNITPAAGGEFDPTDPASLNAIETAAGGEEATCWGDATSMAGSGPVSLSYGGSAEDLLSGEASCGS